MLTVPPQSWWGRLWERFWALPLAITLVSLAASVLIPQVDSWLADHLPYVFQGGPDGARSLLGAIASAMISVTGLVFSITIVTLQLASSQFSPRVLDHFLQSRITQATLGVFVASFVYALSVLRTIRSGDDGYVPQLSVTIAFLLVLAAGGCFLAFIRHITSSIRVSSVMSDIGDDTRASLDVNHPEQHGDPDDAGPRHTWSPDPGWHQSALVLGDRHGVLRHVRGKRLLTLADDAGAVVSLRHRVGEFVAGGQPVATVWRTSDRDPDLEAMARCFELGQARSIVQDPAFGFRQLVDIASRALSPGVNDPTTAAQAVDELHALLRTVAGRPDPSPCLRDEAGVVRVIHQPWTFSSLLDLATDEILAYGSDALPVLVRLDAMLRDLAVASSPEHAGHVAAKRSAVAAALERLRESEQWGHGQR